MDELTKAKEADTRENGILKAQVERLQVELREYRQRLSLNGNASTRSPPLGASRSQHRSSSGGSGNFQFDFPKFGALPGSQLSGQGQNGSATPPSTNQSPIANSNGYGVPQSQQATRQNSQARSNSPQPTNSTSSGLRTSAGQNNFQSYSNGNNMRGFSNTLPQMNNSNGSGDPFGDLFSPSIMKTASHTGNQDGNYFTSQQPVKCNNASNDSGTDSTSGLSRVFQFNSGSNASDSNSPSASSQSQWNGANNSSCGTSPEPSHNGPAENKKSMDKISSKISPPQAQSQQYNNNAIQANNINFATVNTNTDLNVPSLDSFDPVLFGDYRENQDNMFGGNEFGNGFFDDALNPYSGALDYASPSNLFGILQSPQPAQQDLNPSQTVPTSETAPSKNLMAEIEKTRNGGDDDYGLPATQPSKKEEPGKLISCNKIWNQLQSNPDFQGSYLPAISPRPIPTATLIPVQQRANSTSTVSAPNCD